MAGCSQLSRLAKKRRPLAVPGADKKYWCPANTLFLSLSILLDIKKLQGVSLTYLENPIVSPSRD